ncbi:MAG: hypothetical protein ACYCWW_03455 [Deltaproteobacteria bacterium]
MRPVGLALALVGFIACAPKPRGWSAVVRPGASAAAPRAEVVSDGALKRYLPTTLLGRAGAAPQGTMTRIGDRALTEVSRSYPLPPATGLQVSQGAAELKLADARFEPRATEAIRSLVDGETDSDDELSAERLVLPGAIGYARFDEAGRTAQAQVVIAGRFIASATIQPAKGAQDAVTALRSLDTLALSRLAAQSD